MNLNKFRPSRLVGLVEDTVVIAGSRVARGAKSFAHGVHIEYRARQLAANISDVQSHARRVLNMTQAQRDALMRDQVAIADRACELASKR